MRSIFMFNLFFSGKDIFHAYIYHCWDCLANGVRSITGARIFFLIIVASSLTKIQLRHFLRRR